MRYATTKEVQELIKRIEKLELIVKILESRPVPQNKNT